VYIELNKVENPEVELNPNIFLIDGKTTSPIAKTKPAITRA